MTEGYTHITVILDRSGSMECIREDVIGGFNRYLHDQKEMTGTATLTLIQFDTQDPYEVVHHYRPIAEVPELTRETYVPRAATPLFDALGRCLNDVEKSLADLPEDERPEGVVVVIITDGMENSSRELRRDQVRKMVEAKKARGWNFAFLSADRDAILEARDLGIDPDALLLFAKDAQGTASAWAAASAATSACRVEPKRKIGFKRTDRRHPDDPQRR